MSRVLPTSPRIRGCFRGRLRELRAAMCPAPRAFACALGMKVIRYLRYAPGTVEPNGCSR